MIFEYGYSIVGKSHIKKGTGCQDSHCIRRLENGWVIAAVADGVGSAKNSHIGSRIAAQTVVEFCDECMPWDYNLISIKSMMRTAYNFAYKLILREAQKSGEPIESYDTTLTMVIYDGRRIIYGHSGDGAIIGLNTFGDYIEITRPQKGSDGVSVIPLRGGYTQWVIDTYEEDLTSVMLMTDGMLDTLCPYLLKDNVSKKDNIYMPLGLYFSDPAGWSEDAVELSDELNGIKEFLESSDDYDSNNFYNRLTKVLMQKVPNDYTNIINGVKKNNYPVILMNNEQDDKTLVTIINTDGSVEIKPIEFYSEPDWKTLQDAWNRLAYPHLYPNRQNENDEETTEQSVDNAPNISTTDTTEEQNDISTDAATSEEPPKKTDSKTTTGSKEELQNAKLEVPRKADATTESVATATPHTTPTANIQQPNSITQDVSLPSRTKHEKPRKKSLIGKIGDLFD